MIALALVGFWVRFTRDTFAGSSGGVPAPGAFLVPLLFAGIAIAAGVSAIKGNGVAVVLSGLLSLVPVGFYLLLFSTTRPIGLLDAALVVLGVVMLRDVDAAAEDDVSASRREPR